MVFANLQTCNTVDTEHFIDVTGQAYRGGVCSAEIRRGRLSGAPLARDLLGGRLPRGRALERRFATRGRQLRLARQEWQGTKVRRGAAGRGGAACAAGSAGASGTYALTYAAPVLLVRPRPSVQKVASSM